ncbi:MAG: molybdopterin molybdotransferase MoeA [Proteobacteria bacterium]|nr:molybdopterin molybdotransferase MoeA [Pseudomonadota bacterium]MBU1386263.1 molybdopterin molybdotransferase MoeA [Pseudomonadota bacterium]MBU1542956.1 molybdopterin molybdotransferase MoeA [Pseudomonadota bacterium]MBU2431670.1 molybdopterin molybdotransferase MoeA [Pseudomonadota bacterium]MBU2479978.1 molybdopterin molybdotransferase MoeA [Pseudomonadota bacterium]
MNQFFKVKTLEEVLELRREFFALESETIHVKDAYSRVLFRDVAALSDLPGFRRATMDGYALAADATFGASESSPAWLNVQATILMGDVPDFVLEPGMAAKISTGGMLPEGADSVVMVEHTEAVDETSVEIYKSVAPLQNVIDASEDFAQNQVVLPRGRFIRPQEQGLIAGLGFETLEVYQIPKVGIISTGDEIIAINEPPGPGKIRDINSYSLAGFIREAHAIPVSYGIIKDDPAAMKTALEKALEETDMVLISGGSSVGAKDYTLDVLSKIVDTQVLFHGISVSPGKPTILAKSGNKPVWGLPGQVVSAMVVFKIAVVPFLDHIKGLKKQRPRIQVRGRLTRNLSSAQGRRDFVRVLLEEKDGQQQVVPVLGKSGLIRTMIFADGLLEIGEDVEGLEKDTLVDVILL